MIYTLDQFDKWEDMKNKVICGDALELLKMLPDNSIDLVLTDPPYGDGYGKEVNQRASKNAKSKKKYYEPKEWDNKTPSKEVFIEMVRVSRHQIIFGAEYICYMLPKSKGWIVWDKKNGSTDFADCELAWTSLHKPVRKFDFLWNGMLQENMKNKEERFHPTQKPRELMQRIIKEYAPDAKTILDPFMGSWTTAKACQELGRDFIGCDLEMDYCRIGEQRLQHQPLFTV